jgi:hypothetical protein
MLPVLTPVQVAYVTELHDCCDLDEFEPDDCPPCLGCNHCSARHQDLPIGRGVCDVPTCECFSYSSGDDCSWCSGTGTVADNNDNEYACIKCDGHGVTA